MAGTISWPELIVLMVFGDGSEDSFVAEVRVRGDEPDDYGYRIFRRGALVRREGLDGRVHFIDGESYRWIRYAGDEEFTAFPRERHAFASPIGGLDVGGDRPSLSRWDGNDFTAPTGPARPVEFLGRPAWAVELAPPSHKPYPIQLVIDAETGLVLRQANAGFGTYTEFVSLRLGADLPDELFVWDGPAHPPEDHEAEHERDMADRRAWLAVRGITQLPLERRTLGLVRRLCDRTGRGAVGRVAGRARDLDLSAQRRLSGYPDGHGPQSMVVERGATGLGPADRLAPR